MRSPEQVVWGLVQEWLVRAEEDIRIAQELMERERISYNLVGFHAQQATEKFIKAQIADWRAMVDSVMIDTAYNGQVFSVALSDVPERKTDLVA